MVQFPSMSLEQLLQNFITVIIDPLVMLLFAVALLIFFWGLFQLMVDISQGNPGAEGKQHMLWGLVGLTIMFSVWGIIGIISSSIGAESDRHVQGTGGFK